MRDTATADIPVIDAFDAEPALAAAIAEPGRLADLVASACRHYTPVGVEVSDALSRAWAKRCDSPYMPAVHEVAAAVGKGAYLLNHSYEWGCTTGGAEDEAHGGPTLLRVLDWPFDGLGRTLVATRCQAAAGPYVSLTWPGLVGVLTASAPGRFAAAINQPPHPGNHGAAAGWLTARWRIAGSTDMPPTHLLRLAFDTCRTFDEAVTLLRDTPICIPAIFTIVGVNPGETATIERTERAAFLPQEPAAANHWASRDAPAGRPRDATSLKRRADMLWVIRKAPDWSLDWLKNPILNPTTRLAVMANPASGRLVAQGWEKAGAATSILHLHGDFG